MTVLESLRDLLQTLGWFDLPSIALTASRVTALGPTVFLSVVAHVVARYLSMTRTIRTMEARGGKLASILLFRRLPHRLCVIAPLGVGNSLHLEVT